MCLGKIVKNCDFIKTNEQNINEIQIMVKIEVHFLQLEIPSFTTKSQKRIFLMDEACRTQIEVYLF